MSKNLLQSLLGSGNVIPLHKPVLRLTKCFHAAALLEQISFLMPRASDPEGFVYKTRDEWREECCFETEHQFKTAKIRLQELELLQEKTMRVPRGRSHVNLPAYRIDMERLSVLLGGGEIHRVEMGAPEPHAAHQPDPVKSADPTERDSQPRPLDSSPTHKETQHTTQHTSSSSSSEPESAGTGTPPEDEEDFSDFVRKTKRPKAETDLLLSLADFPDSHAAVRFLIPAHVKIFRVALQLKNKAMADPAAFSFWLSDIQQDLLQHGEQTVAAAMDKTLKTSIQYRSAVWGYYKKVLVTLTESPPDQVQDDGPEEPTSAAPDVQPITTVTDLQEGLRLVKRRDAPLERIPKELVVQSTSLIRATGDHIVYCKDGSDFPFSVVQRNYGIPQGGQL